MAQLPLPDSLPSDVERLVAVAALRQAGGYVQTWARLGAVCKAWRSYMEGALYLSYSVVLDVIPARIVVVSLLAGMHRNRIFM